MSIDFGLLEGNVWRDAASGNYETVYSAATLTKVRDIPDANEEDIERILVAAEKGFISWKAVAAWQRAQVLFAASKLIRERAETIAQAISQETGKPFAEGVGETLAAADQFEWYGGEATRIYGEIVPSRASDTEVRVQYEPVGVCLALAAWNFPALLASRKTAAALAAGCSVIVRPPSEAPGAFFHIAQCLVDAGLPPNVLSVVTGDPERISDYLIRSGRVHKVSLTGSVPVGKHVAKKCAEHFVKCSLELGGHAAVVVHKDANPKEAAIACATAKFRNSGQVCISPSRFFVHNDVYPAFSEAFAEFADKLVVGNGVNRNVQMGPLIRKTAVKRSQTLVDDAIRKGAKVLTINRTLPNLDGHFFPPTVLGSVPQDAEIMTSEPFAPIAPITRYSDLDDVICKANNLPYGLAAYAFTDSTSVAQKLSKELQAGMVGINDLLLAYAEIPFGGIKESGNGREGGSQGILDYLSVKYIKHRTLQSPS